ncbi:DNA repair protein RecN [Nannocystis sp. SCPEA4]|uniref:DNA repair protein RecN n=1 Tax=Nannocystis sp. SCPEA4 TaxID=2996787 RepID=UPI00227209D2|nr:DNA repair protein RecN [Nannocystis sp. SCPEA4]
MLSYLHIRGLALLDDVALELGRGMNVLTGETGAGKSIIVDALALLRGARGRAEIVRQGADAARASAQFELDAGALRRLGPALDELGIGEGREALVLERVVGRAGRGRSVVQAVLTTQGMLERVGEQLIDICSQHEHHSLTHVARHIDLLDAYAGLDADAGAYAEQYREWQVAAQAAADLRRRAAEGAARADFLRFQIEEIERVSPEPGELAGLRQRAVLLRDSHRWAAFARQAHDVLYESDDAIAGRLAILLDEARRGADSSRLLGEIQEQLVAAQVACEEAAAAAARFANEMSFEPGDLEQVEERLHELETLKRKHGGDLEALPARLTAMREELSQLDHADAHLEALDARAQELLGKCLQRAAGLHARRAAAAEGLARAVEAELAALHIPRARLEARVEELPPGQLGPRGLDRVEFMFSANPGEPVAPLNRVASGGELSRVLLAIKSVLSTGDSVTTYVFDEVDAGVGGAVAEAIGRRLHAASRQRQVLCITHLPQIAAFADAHFRVEKHTQAGRTITRVVKLSDDERVEELARMLGGSRVTTSAREHAHALIAEARSTPARKKEPRAGRRAQASQS